MTTLPYQGCALLYQGLSDARTGRPLLAIRMQGFMGGAMAAACTGVSGRSRRLGARHCRAGCAKQCTLWSEQRPETREVSPPVGPSLPHSLNSPRPLLPAGAPITASALPVENYTVRVGLGFFNRHNYACDHPGRLTAHSCMLRGTPKELAPLCDADPRCRVMVHLSHG